MMGAALAKIWVELGLNSESFDKGIASARKKLSSWGDDLTKKGRNLTTGLTLPLIAGGVAAVKWASDLNEATSAVATVFGTSATQIAGFNGSVATSLGLTREEALSAAAGLGALYQSVGVTGDAAAGMSNQMLSAAADLGSFFNQPIDQVLADIKSGLVGEAEPLRKYGILLSEAAVQQRALADTGKKNAKELTEADKVLARQKLIYEGLGAAQGDFARTSGGLANKTRIVKAQFKDAVAQLGQQLLPLVLKGVQFLSKLIDRFNKLSPTTKKWILVIAGLAAILGPVLLVIGHIAGALSAMLAIAPALGAAFALLTGPLGLVILGIVALVIAWKKNLFGIQDITKKVIGVIADLFRYFKYVVEDGDYLNDYLSHLPGFLQPIAKFVGKVIYYIKLLGHYFYDVATNKIQPGNLAKLPGWLRPIAWVLGRIIKTLRVFIVTWQKAGLLAAFKTIPMQIRAFGRALANLFDKMGLHHFAQAVKDTFYDIARLLRHFIDLVDDVVHGRWKQVWTDLGRIAVDLFWLFIDRFKLIGALLLDVFNMIPWGRIGSALWVGFQEAVLFLVTTGLPWLVTKGGELLQGLLDGFTGFWDSTLAPWLSSLPGKLFDLIVSDDTFNLLYSIGNFLFDALGKGISFAWNWLWGWFKDLPGRLVGVFDGLWNSFFNIGWSIIAGMSAGIASIWNTLVGWIDSIMNQFNRIPAFLRNGSPSKWAMEVAHSVPWGLSEGIKKGMPKLTKAVSGMTNTIASVGTATGLAAMPAVAGAGAGMGGVAANRPVTFAAGAIIVNNPANGEQVAKQIIRAVRRLEAGTV